MFFNVHDISYILMTLLKFTGFRQKLTNGSETHMEEEDALAVGYEVQSFFQQLNRGQMFQDLLHFGQILWFQSKL